MQSPAGPRPIPKPKLNEANCANNNEKFPLIFPCGHPKVIHQVSSTQSAQWSPKTLVTRSRCEKYIAKTLDCGHSKAFKCYLGESGKKLKCKKKIALSVALKCGHSAPTEYFCFQIQRQYQSKFNGVVGEGEIAKKISGSAVADLCKEMVQCSKICRNGHPCNVQYPCSGSGSGSGSSAHVQGTPIDTATETDAVEHKCPPCEEKIKKKSPCGEHDVSYRCKLEGKIQGLLQLTCPQGECNGNGPDKTSINLGMKSPRDGMKTVRDVTFCKKACKRRHICSSTEFQHKSNIDKCPPCESNYTFRFGNCPHSKTVVCKDAEKRFAYHCDLQCERPRDCEHPCLTPCGDHLSESSCPDCTELVTCLRYCGHEWTQHCFIGDGSQYIFDGNGALIFCECEALVDVKNDSTCGHSVMIPCKVTEELLEGTASLYCVSSCGAFFDPAAGGCGHFCEGLCQSCTMQRFHQPCNQKCSKILYCGHACKEMCSTPCPPCGNKCETFCEHGACQLTCGYPCPPCTEACTYSCPHGRCTNNCGAPCNKIPCLEFCPKKLSCGHLCCGYCGEPCPTLCSICDEKELLEKDMLGKTEITAKDRFILLTDCGHTIDAESLSFLMAVVTVKDEIAPKKCPSCRTVIQNCPRYKSVILNIRKDVDSVKRIVLEMSQGQEANKKLQEIRQNSQEAFRYLLKASKKQKMVQQGESGSGPEPVPNIEALLKFIEKRIREKLLEEPAVALSIPLSRVNPRTLIFNKDLSLRESQSLLFLSKLYNQAKHLLNKIEFEETHLLNPHVVELKPFMIRLFTAITSETRPWPLSGFDMTTVEQEWARIAAANQLFSKASKQQPPVVQRLFKQETSQAIFKEAAEIINRFGPFDEGAKKRLSEAVQKLEASLNCKLSITEEERNNILKSFTDDGFTRPPKFYKCPAGHYYAVTECGNPIEEIRCSECFELIGGIDHRLLPSNEAAHEMNE